MMREIGMSIPEFFTCPISLELFKDPVTLCTGQTYDRPSIEKWLAAGNLTCPVTMQKLQDLSMVPNHTLKHLIHQWHSKGSHNFHQFNDVNLDYYDDFCEVGSSKNASFSSLKHVLELQGSSLEKKMQVLEQIGLLSEDLPRKNGGLIQLGFFPLILGLIFGAKITQEKIGLVEKSLVCALKLMQFSNLGDFNMLLEDSKFENFKVLLQEGSCMIKTTLCNIVEKVFLQSSLVITKELATKIGNDTKILKAMVGYVGDHDQKPELAEASIKAILSIASCSSHEQYRENLVKEGVVNSLITYILEVESSKDYKDLAPKATKALELVLELESGKQALLVKEVINNGIKALIKMVFRVSGDDLGSESAVNCLMKLCYESIEVSEKAICGGVLTQLLLLLQSQCSGRAKSRARMLLKLLRSMWAKDPIHV